MTSIRPRPTLPAVAGAPDRFFPLLLVLASGALTAGRIFAVPGPFGPNDISRWATVAALVETDSYAIGRRVTNSDGSYRDLKAPVMIDVLLRPDTQEFYSSKPPLLPTLLAAEMTVLKRAFGWAPGPDGLELLQALLLTSNALPIVLYLLALLLVFERLGASPRATGVLMLTAGFGTLVTTFATSLTNHVGATAGAGLALLAFVAIWIDRERSPKWFILAGLASGWTASQEVPALCLPVVMALLLSLRDRRRTLALFLPSALLPLAAFFVTNRIALGDALWFYHPDPTWSKFPGSYWTQKVGVDRGEASPAAYVFHFTFGHHGVFSLEPIFLASFAGMMRLLRRGLVASLLAALLGLAAIVGLRYLYQEVGLPLPLAMLPLALAAGAALGMPRRWWLDEARAGEVVPRLAAGLTILTFGFYLLHTSNYGGVACGPRWLMWLVPFWLAAALPVVEAALSSRRGHALLFAALAVSIFTASAPGLNPWTHPWLYDLFGPDDRPAGADRPDPAVDDRRVEKAGPGVRGLDQRGPLRAVPSRQMAAVADGDHLLAVFRSGDGEQVQALLRDPFSVELGPDSLVAEDARPRGAEVVRQRPQLPLWVGPDVLEGEQQVLRGGADRDPRAPAKALDAASGDRPGVAGSAGGHALPEAVGLGTREQRPAGSVEVKRAGRPLAPYVDQILREHPNVVAGAAVDVDEACRAAADLHRDGRCCPQPAGAVVVHDGAAIADGPHVVLGSCEDAHQIVGDRADLAAPARPVVAEDHAALSDGPDRVRGDAVDPLEPIAHG